MQYKSTEHQALDAAVKGWLKFDFQRYFTDEMLEGFVSKGYVEVRNDKVHIRLPGIRRLMDIEGLPYD